MSQELEFAVDLAKNAGELLVDLYHSSGMQASLKADRSVVTEADLAADCFIRAAIAEAFPGEQLLSEEHAAQIADLACPTWIIDPLDGTTNFSLGLHVWGVLIARLVDGRPHTAACYFPLLAELYTAEHGAGAFLNGEPIQAKPPDKDQPVSFFSCCARTHRNYTVDIPYKPRILGSAGYTLCAVARGAAVLGFEATPKVWDLAAGWLVAQEAGCAIAPYSGPSPFPLQPSQDYNALVYPTLVAATSERLAWGRQRLTPLRKTY
jgi:myo-inositol-1(or 4)-monophosphatase